MRTSADVELTHVIGPAEPTGAYEDVDKGLEDDSRAAAKTAGVYTGGAAAGLSR